MNDPARPIALIGLRASGKSSVAVELASLLGAPAIDLDVEVGRSEQLEPSLRGASAGELLERLGREGFRDLEGRALARSLADARFAVIATGGGVVEREHNRSRLRARAHVVWLRVAHDVAAERMRRDPTARPALLGVDPIAEIAAVAASRELAYASTCDFGLDVGLDAPPRIALRIVASMRQRELWLEAPPRDARLPAFDRAVEQSGSSSGS